MKLLDVNVLLYAIDETSPRHELARLWLERALSGTQTIALSWTVLIAFIRLSTRHSIFASPLTPQEALDVVDDWLSQPVVIVVHPGRRHAQILRELLDEVGTAGNLVTDAHLAALSIEHGAELCSSDADFARFPGVRWIDPLR